MKRLSLTVLVALAGCAGPGLRLVPDGYARISIACADQAAEVTVDGAPAGRASDYAQSGGRLLVKPGWHRIELRSAGGQRAVREALLGSGDDVALSVRLLSEKGGS